MPHRRKRKRGGKSRTEKSVDQDNKRYQLKGRIWIDGPDGTFIGYGRVVLLERIQEFGSITKAAKSMDMSYRHAWRLIDSMNKQAPSPFVVTATGGKGGGGTRVTKHGEEAIRLFRQTSADFHEFLQDEEVSIRFTREKL
jgi:molybdate transport system regulatory protein